MAGRDTPRSRPTTKTAAAMAAPVDPADTMPSASPVATRRAATVTDASFLSRMAEAASSPISITWVAGTTPMASPAPAAASWAVIRSRSPTSTVSMPFRAAARVPWTISPGARSPPIASTAIRATCQAVGTTARPLYVPHVGQARCGMCAEPQREQVAMAGAETFQVALRRRVLDRDIFFLGTAMAGHPRCGDLIPGLEHVPESRKGRVRPPSRSGGIQVVLQGFAKSLTRGRVDRSRNQALAGRVAPPQQR